MGSSSPRTCGTSYSTSPSAVFSPPGPIAVAVAAARAALVVASSEPIRDLRLEQLLDHLAKAELRERGALRLLTAGANRRFSVSLTDEVVSPSYYFQQFSDAVQEDEAVRDRVRTELPRARYLANLAL